MLDADARANQFAVQNAGRRSDPDSSALAGLRE
jgi:hypothetical protein